MKNHGDLLENDRITFLTMDGRKGLKENGPFDVIHVGTSIGIDSTKIRLINYEREKKKESAIVKQITNC